MLNRAEYLACAKMRARQYLDQGDLMRAYGSMVSDLRKHPETSDHPALEAGMLLQMTGYLTTPEKMQEFIEGFN